MAHQAHNIPWETLASNLKFRFQYTRYKGETNLFPCHKPGQGKQLMFFARIFARTIQTVVQSERAKYPAIYNAASPDKTVISPEVARKIDAAVRRYRSTGLRLADEQTCLFQRGRPQMLQCCACSLSVEERRMSLWLRDPFKHGNHHGVYYGGSDSNDAIELAKTLLLHGQMDTLFCINAHPSINMISAWQLEPHNGGEMLGFAELVRSTLMSYICLNVFFLKPETYDAKCQLAYWKKYNHETMAKIAHVDYRMTTSYQKMLSRCTGQRQFDVHTYPHRQFFGIGPDMYCGADWRRVHAGRNWTFNPAAPGNLHGACGGEYKPVRSDISLVIVYLGWKGLPTELALHVLDLAAYTPQRRLPIAGDPLHVKNATELRKYLTYCWKLLIWSDVLAMASGYKINWIYEITYIIFELWGDKNRNMVSRSWDDEREAGFLGLDMPKYEFV